MQHFSIKNLPSTQQHSFSQVPRANIPRSSFDRSHGYKTTFDSGYLVPIFMDEVLPGDTHSVSLTSMARLSTPIVPIMDNLWADVFFFFVPNRLLWVNWEKFNGAQDNPGDSISFTVPRYDSTKAPLNAAGFATGTMPDYFGLPTLVPGIAPNVLYARAYNKIYNAWFRDQNMQNSVTENTGNGPDDPANYTLKRRGKRHDYFTSCLPWPQKGTAVTIPLGTTAPIVVNPTTGLLPVLRLTGTHALATANKAISTGASSDFVDAAPENILYDPVGTLQADLSSATAATINALRQSFQIQRLMERDARGGTRYTEIIQSHFGVTSPDARLQRPEYLGGGSTRVGIASIPQTSATGATGTPQGNLAAAGGFSHSGVGFTKSFTEHGVLLGLIAVRADLSYQQGLSREHSRQTRYDFYWPALSQIGEQAVLNQEIFCVDPSGGGAAQNAAAFGYQERYGEYRYKPSLITGKLRSNATGTLDIWHLAQNFASTLPVLGDTFISDSPPVSRIVAVNTEPQFILDTYFKMVSVRPMPRYGVPGNMDRL